MQMITVPADRRLSPLATGLLAHILAAGAAWKPATAAQIIGRAIFPPTDGLADALDELATAGYLSRHRGMYAPTRDTVREVAAARLAAEHQRYVQPPQPRPEAAGMAQLIRELILGGADPAHVGAALGVWRDMRLEGANPARAALATLTDQAARRSASAVPGGWAVLHTCGNWHDPDSSPCPDQDGWLALHTACGNWHDPATSPCFGTEAR